MAQTVQVQEPKDTLPDFPCMSFLFPVNSGYVHFGHNFCNLFMGEPLPPTEPLQEMVNAYAMEMPVIACMCCTKTSFHYRPAEGKS